MTGSILYTTSHGCGQRRHDKVQRNPEEEIGNRVNCHRRYPTEDIGAEAETQPRADKNNTEAVAPV